MLLSLPHRAAEGAGLTDQGVSLSGGEGSTTLQTLKNRELNIKSTHWSLVVLSQAASVVQKNSHWIQEGVMLVIKKEEKKKEEEIY